MKASGLIGLIVVVLFFIVHTMLGALSPKKPAPPPQSAPAQTGVPGPPPPAGGPDSAPEEPGEGFPTGKLASAKESLSESSSLNLNISDPFSPIRDTNARPTASGGRINTEPHVSVQAPNFDPMRPVGPVTSSFNPPAFKPTGDSGGSLPPLSALGLGSDSPGPNGSQPEAAAAPPTPEPEIRLIGVVHGEPSVATVQVDGHNRVIRPGDALAKGYRVMAIHTEGIQIRHDGQWITLRVGTGLNEPKQAQKQ